MTDLNPEDRAHLEFRSVDRTHVPGLERRACNQRPKTNEHSDLKLYRYGETNVYQWWSRKNGSCFEDPCDEPFVIIGAHEEGRRAPGGGVVHADDCQSHIVDTRGRPDDCTCGAEEADRGNHDCLAKRRPGEPMFIFLGRDPDGHNLVRLWAERRLAAGGDPEHCQMGLDTAARMQAYAADLANRPASAPPAEAYPPVSSPVREAWVLQRNDRPYAVYFSHAEGNVILAGKREEERQWREENAHVADIRTYWNLFKADQGASSTRDEASIAPGTTFTTKSGAQVTFPGGGKWVRDEAALPIPVACPSGWVTVPREPTESECLTNALRVAADHVPSDGVPSTMIRAEFVATVIREYLAAAPQAQPVSELPEDVVRLAIAVRETMTLLAPTYPDETEATEELERAVEAFSARVPYENEPAETEEGR